MVAQNLQLEQRILELNSQVDRSTTGVRQRLAHHGTGHHRVTSTGSLSSQSNRSLVVSPTSPGRNKVLCTFEIFKVFKKIKYSYCTGICSSNLYNPPIEIFKAMEK